MSWKPSTMGTPGNRVSGVRKAQTKGLDLTQQPQQQSQGHCLPHARSLILAGFPYIFSERYTMKFSSHESLLLPISLTQFWTVWDFLQRRLGLVLEMTLQQRSLFGRQPTQNMPTVLHNERFGFTWEQEIIPPAIFPANPSTWQNTYGCK